MTPLPKATVMSRLAPAQGAAAIVYRLLPQQPLDVTP
jgi:hypothetical protein